MTPLVIIYSVNPHLPARRHVRFCNELNKCTLTYKLCIYQGVHYQIITNITVLHLSHSLFSNANELQSGPNMFLSDHFTLQRCMHRASALISNCLSCFVLGKCSMNHPYASRPMEENKWAWNPEWIRVGDNFWIC